MKNNFVLMAIMAITLMGCSRMLSAQEYKGPAAIMLNQYAPRNFVEGIIPAADLDTIIQAGIRAPSAGNRQPWHFTVVQSPALAKKVINNNENGNVLVIVSAQGDGKTNSSHILDCALAVESMYLAAQALGYGSRIYTGPMDNLNRNLKGDLGLPSGYSAVALVRVGKAQAGVDAVSAASTRKKAEELVTYK